MLQGTRIEQQTTGNERSSSRSRIERMLPIRPGEGRRVSLLFLQLFAATGTFILGRTVRDTLFLSRYSVGVLPWMFVLYGLVSSVAAMLYGRYADRLPRSKLLYATSAFGIASYFAVWVLIRGRISWVYPFFYIWAELLANLFILQFWTFASEFDCPREARRLNTVIGAARPVGTIFFGTVTGGIVSTIGTEQLLFVLLSLAALYAGCVYLLRHGPRLSEPRECKMSARRPGPHQSPLEKAYFRALAGLILIMFIALTLGDYQFKIIARSAFREDLLARFFSLFYGVVGLLSTGFQLFLTPRLLSRFGVGSALTVMPVVFGSSSFMLLFSPGLPVACAMKFADNGLQYTLHDTTMQSLYAPFPAATRARTRGFLEGAIKPLSYGAGGLLVVLLITANLDVRQMSFATVALALWWQLLVPVVRQRYLRSLERGLAGPMAAQIFEEPFVLGSVERKILIGALASPNAGLAMIALDQLQDERSPEFRDALVKFLERPEGALRARTIRLLEAMEDSAHVPEFKAASQDRDPVVRAAAVAALARFLGDEDPSQILPFMTDPSPEVRSLLLARLIRYGGLEASTRAGERLLELEESPDPSHRREACSVLGLLGHTAYLSLAKLFRDSNPRVRRAALRAAASTGDRRLAPGMIHALYDPTTRHTALTALVALGEPAVPFIDQALHDPKLPRAVRLELPRTLSKVPSEKSFAVLEGHADDPDSHIRLRVYAAMGRLRARLGRAPMPVAHLLPRIKREVLDAGGNILAWDLARERFETKLLVEEMNFRIRRSERRILRLLEMTYDIGEVAIILAGLEDPTRRTDALDALDALLPPSIRDLIMPLLENREITQKLLPFEGPAPGVLPPTDFMLLQTYHPNPYVALLALDAMARAGEEAAIPAAELALDHQDPLVREGGLRALVQLRPETAREYAARLVNDPDAEVARPASRLAGSRGITQEETKAIRSEDIMYGTVEKILLLKSTPLFAGLPGEDLAPLARVAEVVTFPPGDLIFTAGSITDHFYVVISGLVTLEGRGRELRRVAPPETLGELAVLDRVPNDTAARAIEPSELLRIGAEEFFEILRSQPEIAEALLRILAGQLRDAHRQLLEQAEARDRKDGSDLSPPTSDI